MRIYKWKCYNGKSLEMTQKVPNLKIVKKSSNKDSSKVSALSPREIVSELDRYVIGQHQLKEKRSRCIEK